MTEVEIDELLNWLDGLSFTSNYKTAATLIRDLRAQLAKAQDAGWNEAIEAAEIKLVKLHEAAVSYDGKMVCIGAIRALTRPTPTAGDKG